VPHVSITCSPSDDSEERVANRNGLAAVVREADEVVLPQMPVAVSGPVIAISGMWPACTVVAAPSQVRPAPSARGRLMT
jgi:hypothetical protein